MHAHKSSTYVQTCVHMYVVSGTNSKCGTKATYTGGVPSEYHKF
jgi:hypothetical protein